MLAQIGRQHSTNDTTSGPRRTMLRSASTRSLGPVILGPTSGTLPNKGEHTSVAVLPSRSGSRSLMRSGTSSRNPDGSPENRLDATLDEPLEEVDSLGGVFRDFVKRLYEVMRVANWRAFALEMEASVSHTVVRMFTVLIWMTVYVWSTVYLTPRESVDDTWATVHKGFPGWIKQMEGKNMLEIEALRKELIGNNITTNCGSGRRCNGLLL